MGSSERIVNAERQAQARDVLQSEEAKRTFDQLCGFYPDAAVFWSSSEGWAELGLFPEPLQSGVSMSKVQIRVA
jgi:hypothetical protein